MEMWMRFMLVLIKIYIFCSFATYKIIQKQYLAISNNTYDNWVVFITIQPPPSLALLKEAQAWVLRKPRQVQKKLDAEIKIQTSPGVRNLYRHADAVSGIFREALLEKIDKSRIWNCCMQLGLNSLTENFISYQRFRDFYLSMTIYAKSEIDFQIPELVSAALV